ncbi:MAG: hypothetical protein KGO96_10460 [Elusimicrobia bacterium]|nr:hypothetical protein [Elusimicrobiota bacterium]
MAFKLSPEVQKRLQAARQAHEDQRVVFANLSDDDLAASAEFWMQHCVQPRQVEPGRPVYDSTFWHIIAPEIIRRLRDRGDSL